MPERYRLRYASQRVAKQLRDLPPQVFRRVDEAILALKDNPRPPSARKLRRIDIGDYRLRIGDYRIIYDINEERREIILVRVMHRREAYRK